MTSAYLNLSLRGGALARLAILRNAAAHTNAPGVNLPPSLRRATWREAREDTFLTISPDLSQGFNVTNPNSKYETRVPIWTTYSGPQFRDERYADDVDGAGIDHTGWFTDEEQSRKLRAIVARLPHGRFMAGYYNTDNGERLYLAKVYDDETDAARAGDSWAETDAEYEREYNERWNAAQRINEAIETREKDVRELFPMRHHARARRELADAIDTLRTLRDELTNDYSDISF